jgi:3',5'-cyclic AMP phosphodiesterase CpdA
MTRPRRLYALSDLHVRFTANRDLVRSLPTRADDGLILAGDVGEREDDLAFTFEALRPKFHSLFWVPGNHELWTLPGESLRGEAKYRRMVEVCRSFGVKTPEDEFAVWEGSGEPASIALTMALYDYTFAPDAVAGDVARARAWALEDGLRCTDEELLSPDPHASLAAWCEAACARAEARLDAIPLELSSVLVNHFPLHREHAILPRIPRFSIWCGTRRTASWPARARARVVVYGHLHVPITIVRDGVRYEEVSLGYPKQWIATRAPGSFLREILPGPPAAPDGFRARRAG